MGISWGNLAITKENYDHNLQSLCMPASVRKLTSLMLHDLTEGLHA